MTNQDDGNDLQPYSPEPNSIPTNGAVTSTEGGARMTPGVPSIDDVIIQDLGERFNPVKEMMVFPSDAQAAIPRSVISTDDAVNIIRSYMGHKLYQEGKWDVSELLWLKMATGVGIDGRGRNEAVEMSGGILGSLKRRVGRFGSGHAEDQKHSA